MRRREFITLLGGAAAASSLRPPAARAQQAMQVVGFLSGRPVAASQFLVAAFRQGLAEAGYTEGRNVAVEYRFAEARYDRLPAMASDLIGRRVAAIATSDNASTLAAKSATSTIPILFNTGSDPVKLGLVASLSRPGGNLTGVTNLNEEVGPKRLELMHQVAPGAALLGFLMNPTNPTHASDTSNMQKAARAVGLELQVLGASSDREIDAAFASLTQTRAGGLVIWADAFFTVQSEQLAALSLRYALPAIYQFREFAAAGGLMSYGGSITDAHRQIGAYAGRILKGEMPGDIPVQQSTKVELLVNLKTAKALGVTIPLSILTRADEVIE
jgi:putative tryptophan/tyrosine transport system substrate-binding protein